MRRQPGHHLIGHVETGPFVFLRIEVEEVVHQQRNVLAPVAKRREFDLDGLQPEQKILPKAALVAQFVQGHVRRRDDAHVDRFGRIGPHRENLPLFERGQQFRLQVQGKIADLVQKQRSALGRLHSPRAVSLRICEATLAMAEEFAFEKRFRHGAEVDGDERLLRPARLAMDLARDEFLAGAVLAEDQDIGIGGCRPRDERQHALHRRRIAEQGRTPRWRRSLARLPARGRGCARSMQPRRIARDGDEPVVVPGFEHEIGRAALHGLDGDLYAAVRGDHHDRKIGVARKEAAEPVEPL